MLTPSCRAVMLPGARCLRSLSFTNCLSKHQQQLFMQIISFLRLVMPGNADTMSVSIEIAMVMRISRHPTACVDV
jgi:hypothetical protein